ncbi:MAG: hypothetical protein IPM57_05220 [Oligoflexia bacterium]|nr:hypothetical protein [Oligoflexia bacterium]
MEKVRKITVQLPEELVDAALKSTGESLTETLRMGLKLIAARQAYDYFLNMRGKIKIDIDYKKLRED